MGSAIKELLTVIRLARQPADLERLCLDALRRNPGDRVASAALARHYYQGQRHESAYSMARVALQQEVTREMALIAASSAFSLKDMDAAREHANVALTIAGDESIDDLFLRSRMMKLLGRLPGLRSAVAVLEEDAIRQKGHQEALLSWAREFLDYPAHGAAGA